MSNDEDGSIITMISSAALEDRAVTASNGTRSNLTDWVTRGGKTACHEVVRKSLVVPTFTCFGCFGFVFEFRNADRLLNRALPSSEFSLPKDCSATSYLSLRGSWTEKHGRKCNVHSPARFKSNSPLPLYKSIPQPLPRDILVHKSSTNTYPSLLPQPPNCSNRPEPESIFSG